MSIICRAMRRSSSRLLRAAGVRHKTVLVGVDGSKFGFAALRRGLEAVNDGDKVVCLHFPPSLELMMMGADKPTHLWNDIMEHQRKLTQTIEDECQSIVNEECPKSVDYSMGVGEHSLSAKHDLVKSCYDHKADTLVVGARGLAHGLRETLKEDLHRLAGSVPDYVMHHAPCDVLVVRTPHEY